MKNKSLFLRVFITIIAVGFIIVHLIFPNLKIDSITLVLLVFALIPWITQIFESLELPGGWKFTFRKLEKTGQKAEQLGMISNEITTNDEKKYSFQLVDNDPNLALAGLRIEIEKRLKILAERNGIGTNMQGIGRLLQILSNRNLIGQNERSLFADMIGLLNEAVHGAKLDNRAYKWALDFGPRLLKALDEKNEE